MVRALRGEDAVVRLGRLADAWTQWSSAFAVMVPPRVARVACALVVPWLYGAVGLLGIVAVRLEGATGYGLFELSLAAAAHGADAGVVRDAITGVRGALLAGMVSGLLLVENVIPRGDLRLGRCVQGALQAGIVAWALDRICAAPGCVHLGPWTALVEWVALGWGAAYAASPWLPSRQPDEAACGTRWWVAAGALAGAAWMAWEVFGARSGGVFGAVVALVVCAPLVAFALPRWEVDSVPPPVPPIVATVRIEAGAFLMGSAPSEDGRYSVEGPQREVRVAAFEIGRTVVTRGEYRAVAEASPVRLHLPSEWGKDDDALPANFLSWQDALSFCRALDAVEAARGSVAAGFEHRLPSEAEWEYACRAGTTTRFSFGNADADLDAHASWSGNSGGQAHPVAERKPNGWGLFDMHGNVWEWCEDRWHDGYEGAPADGTAWEFGDDERRVLRGGSFFSGEPGYLRSAYRLRVVPAGRRPGIGFRVVRASRRQP